MAQTYKTAYGFCLQSQGLSLVPMSHLSGSLSFTRFWTSWRNVFGHLGNSDEKINWTCPQNHALQHAFNCEMFSIGKTRILFEWTWDNRIIYKSRVWQTSGMTKNVLMLTQTIFLTGLFIQLTDMCMPFMVVGLWPVFLYFVHVFWRSNISFHWLVEFLTCYCPWFLIVSFLWFHPFCLL